MPRSREFLFWSALTCVDKLPEIIVNFGSCNGRSDKSFVSMGHSVLAWLCVPATVYDVDHEKRWLENTRNIVNERLGHKASQRLVSVHCDALMWAVKQDLDKIDLLYLDGPGGDLSIDCLRQLERQMPIGSVLLMDDCDIGSEKDGRRKVLPYAEQHGFTILRDNGRQILLIRENK